MLLVGILLAVIAFLLYRSEQHFKTANDSQMAMKQETIGILKMEIEYLKDQLEIARRAQQARMNYDSLLNVENGQANQAVLLMQLAESENVETARHAAYMKRLREQRELAESVISSLAKAHNPKNGNGAKGK